MKLWVDDLRPAPHGYYWCKTVDFVKDYIREMSGYSKVCVLEEINLDHDAGKYAVCGGDYIEILKWLEEQQRLKKGVVITDKTIFRFHTMNPVGRENMLRICERNNWKVIV